MVDNLVEITINEQHPKTLPLIEFISRLGLLVPAELGAVPTNAGRIIERLYGLMSEDPVALEILNVLARKYGSVRENLAQRGILEQIVQLLKETNPQVVIKACDLIRKLLGQSTQDSQLSLNVSSELAALLDSDQDEVAEAALGVAKVLASVSMGAEQAFINKLISTAREGRHRDIILAILGRINYQVPDRDIGDSFVPSFVQMMDDQDRWLVRGAISGLIAQAGDGMYL
ncbi:hypothetical protein FRC10_002049 [Ceratobasidium sp. 414]|nr:hypothetical protein FRC10_002049 [Ceratobasidium sp. 414]